MLITKKSTGYPSFDLSEIITEPVFTTGRYSRLQPVQSGAYLHGFTLQGNYASWQHFFNGAEAHGSLQLNKLYNKPLVIHFYEAEWMQDGLYHLKQLNTIQAEIGASGGNLLIVTSSKSSALEKLVWENNLSLDFYFDPDRKLARGFRIYDDADPVWNRFSGIDINIPLPATFVLDTDRQVVYDRVIFNLQEFPVAKDIISAVYTANLSGNLKRSA